MENTIDTLATKTLAHHLRNNKETRDALFIFRDDVPVEIKHCSDNVDLVFHLDSVLKDSICLTVGSAENCPHISVRILLEKVDVEIDSLGRVKIIWVFLKKKVISDF